MRHLHLAFLSTLLVGCGSAAPSSGAPTPTEAPQPPPARRPEEGADSAPTPRPTPLPDALLAHRRTGWLPELGDAGADTPQGSRFGGRPWLPTGVTWPVCPGCGKTMHLLVQLAVDTLPEDTALSSRNPLPAGTLLQLFYCTSDDPLCEDDLESYAPFGRAVVGRFVPNGPGALGETADIEAFPARPVTGWRRMPDLPGSTEADELDIELSDEQYDALLEQNPDTRRTKWRGWPQWVQSVEYPECRTCGTRMTYLLQLDSNDPLPVQFGDLGNGHLSVCPVHPEEISFHWAC